MTVRLFHFSDDDSIDYFEPRSAQVPSPRPEGKDWLNGPLVWAIDDWHQPMYLFPRDCPRILLWRKNETKERDIETYLGSSTARIVAHVENRWMPELDSATLYRYELPASSFVSLQDAGMWVSRNGVRPIERVKIDDLPARLKEQGVELRALDVLTPLRNVWSSTLHASGIRLRNALNWN